ncbi:MAG: flagellar biosynthesis anti-sigma factor FlgM [Pseudomonadota bacterium]
MKIQNDESVINVRSLMQAQKDTPVITKAQENSTTEGDQVQLSDRAKEFNRIKDMLEKVPEVRENKVAALSEAVGKGTYSADPVQTSDKLIQSSLIDILA